MKRLIPILAVISLMIGSFVIGYDVCLWARPILPVSTRQRRFYEYGYMDYEGIDGLCGKDTHFAQELYEQ